MGSLLASLAPFILGSALVPLQIVIGLVLLRSPDQGVAKATAYMAAMIATRMVQGALFGLVFTASSVAAADEEGGGNSVVSTLLIVVGVLLLVTACRQWLKADDPDAPPPGWLATVNAASTVKAFGIGIGLTLIAPKLWIFTLGALATIEAAKLGQPRGTIAFVVFALLAQSLLTLPILLRVIVPQRSMVILDGIADWLVRNNRVIVIAVSLLFGLLFLRAGVNAMHR